MAQIGWLLWWPRTSSYFIKCNACTKNNISRWTDSSGRVYPIFKGDLGFYHVVCNCGNPLQFGSEELFPSSEAIYGGLSGFPTPDEFTRGR
jgi:hypothetical protein